MTNIARLTIGRQGLDDNYAEVVTSRPAERGWPQSEAGAEARKGPVGAISLACLPASAGKGPGFRCAAPRRL